MNGPNNAYEITISVDCYQRNNGNDRMGLRQSFVVSEQRPALVFDTLHRFADLAERVKSENGFEHLEATE